MSVKKTYLVLLFLLLACGAGAQQFVTTNSYFFQPLQINPAFAGSTESLRLFATYKKQWTGFNESPFFNYLSFSGPVGKSFGAGLTAYSESMGISKRSQINAVGSYHLALSDEASLSFGVEAGAAFHRIDFSKVKVLNPEDPLLLSGAQNTIRPDLRAGVALIYDQLQLGFSVPQVLGNDQHLSSASSSNLVQHYLASARYSFALSEEKELFFSPMVLAKMIPGEFFQWDVNAFFEKRDLGWIGAIYKSEYAVTASAGINLFQKKLAIGYNHDFVLNELVKPGLSHEIFLAFNFAKKKEAAPDVAPPATDTIPAVNEEKIKMLEEDLILRERRLAEHESYILKLIDELFVKAKENPEGNYKEEIDRIREELRIHQEEERKLINDLKDQINSEKAKTN